MNLTNPVDRSRALPSTFWITRDREHGVLLDYVEVWAVFPDRIQFTDGDVMWFAPVHLVDAMVTCLGEWDLVEARKHVGNGIPDDDVQCIRSGPPVPMPEFEP